MKKDIIIPIIKDVYIAIVKESNEESIVDDWIVYLINDSDQPLESVMILSRGKHNDGRKTSIFRHAFKEVTAKTVLKVELMMEEVFAFENEFVLTYFIGRTLFDRVYTAAPFTISEEAFEKLPLIDHQGVLLK